MNNLSQECIEQIEKESNIYSKIPYDKVCFERGAEVSLTNPTIYQSAGLMTVEEMVDFYKWATLNKWELWCHTNWVNKNHTGVLTTTELLNIFRNQNQ